MFIVCTFLPKQIPCMCKRSWRINPFLILIVSSFSYYYCWPSSERHVWHVIPSYIDSPPFWMLWKSAFSYSSYNSRWIFFLPQMIFRPSLTKVIPWRFDFCNRLLVTANQIDVAELMWPPFWMNEYNVFSLPLL